MGRWKAEVPAGGGGGATSLGCSRSRSAREVGRVGTNSGACAFSRLNEALLEVDDTPPVSDEADS